MGLFDRLRRRTESVAKASTDLAPVLRAAVDSARNLDTAPVPPDAAVESAMTEQGMQSRAFAPGRPINPIDNISGDPRATNFRTGENSTARPRSERVSFETLRAITSSYDVARICIQHRIDDVRSLGYHITNIDGENGDRTEEIARARKVIARPDGATPFAAWLHAFLEDVLRYDAGCLHRRRNRRGDVIGLEVVDGTTIVPLKDFYGRRPAAPAPAFVQYANGVPWSWLTVDDIIYTPFRPQADSLYGLPPMEWLLLNANTDIRFQWHFLKFFTEGTVPDGFMQAPPEISSPEQVQEWQDAWDAFTLGDQGVKHQVKWVPHGANFQAARDDKFDPTFPLFLMRKTCAAYGVTPNDLGFTDDVNRSTGETQVEIQFRVGTMPLLRHVEQILDSFLQDDLGLQVQFRFDTGQEKDDRLEEAQAHDLYVKMGAESVDEVREKVLGLPVDPGAPIPRFIFSTRAGAIPLKSIMEIAGDINQETMSPQSVEQVETTGGVHILPTGTVPDKNDARTLSGAQPATAAAPGTPVDQQGDQPAPEPTEVAADVKPVEKAAELDEVVRKWHDVSRTRVRKGMKPRRFTDVPPHIADPIWAALEGAASREEVDAAFKAAPRPKAPGEHGPVGDELVAHWAPRITTALASLRPHAVEVAIDVMERSSVAKASGEREALIAAAIAQFRLRMGVDVGVMEAAVAELSSLYTDSFVAGAHVAAVQTQTAPPAFATGVNWSTWTPGNAPAAAAVTGEGGLGLRALLDRAGIVLAGISDTQLDRIAEALANGLRQGLPAQVVGRQIADIVGDTQRGYLIASTEMARAMSEGSLQVYRDTGVVEKIEWLSEADCCDICDGNTTASPVGLNDGFPSGDWAPPAHPNCRCAVAPVIDIPSAPSGASFGGEEG